MDKRKRPLSARQVSAPDAQWRLIPGFPGYRISDEGEVQSAWAYNGHQARRLGDIWQTMIAGKRGVYPQVGLYRDGRCFRHSIHVLVLTAFRGRCPLGMETCHNDGDPANCRLDNLRWDTHEANQRDRVRHGTAPRGERSGVAKLTAPEVIVLKRRLAAGERSVDIAATVPVSVSAIRAIKSGQNWGWLEVVN